MGDIVERLRSIDHMNVEECFLDSYLYAKAADEIERLREALNFYAANHEWPNEGPWCVDSTDFGDVARAVLKGDE